MKWGENLPSSGLLDRKNTFSCIAAFESGNCDVDPNLLTDVMALSAGDSMYVTAGLLNDPTDPIRPCQMHRIVGNVGRPGITMLIPPSQPEVRKTGPENWNVINHADFDGKNQDNFTGTSLHLSFSEYNPPMSTGRHGARDHEVFLLESIISVHDHGTWIADLDILRSLDDSQEALRFTANIDGDSEHARAHGATDSCVLVSGFTSLDTWDEFLAKRPRRVGIARAYENWVARLELFAISRQQGLRAVLVQRPGVCWACLEGVIRREWPGVHPNSVVAIC